MELGEGNAGGAGMGGVKEWRPGKRLAIEVVADGSLMDFIGPLADLDGGFAVFIGENAGDGCVLRDEMGEKAMLFEEAFAIADRAGMTLDEDAAVASAKDTGGGKWTRTDCEDALGFDVMRKASEDGAHFVESERSPVGLNPGAVDSVCSWCG